MWLREFREQQERSSLPLDQQLGLEPDEAGEGYGYESTGITLTKDEHDRLGRHVRSLYEELAAAVRHIDPAEYSEERVQELLAQAHRKSATPDEALDS